MQATKRFLLPWMQAWHTVAGLDAVALTSHGKNQNTAFNSLTENHWDPDGYTLLHNIQWYVNFNFIKEK